MVGSADAPEPGFRPGARWGARLVRTWPAANPPGFRPGTRGALARAGGLACAGGLWRAGGPGMRWGPGARWRALARAGGSGARRGGVGFPWRLTRSRLCLGWCCGLRVVVGLPVCGAACGGERHVLPRSYVVGVHWVRAYVRVVLGEWRTDAASEEVYVGAGGGIASVA